ncbi:MAG: cell wall-binding repeat-containing protein [Actinomycetota bacterium]|jgi:putative cell wall-binding protein/5-hydroxyisourate hydrolase-like protein (transthyretin family)|nr:cell wall-binding repeat-containing protein [Actinomycetota bacterium]
MRPNSKILQKRVRESLWVGGVALLLSLLVGTAPAMASTAGFESIQDYTPSAIQTELVIINGSVTSNQGAPLADATVRLYRASDDGTWPVAATLKSDASGAFRQTDLPAGDYRVWFDVPDSLYVSEYFHDATDFDQAFIVETVPGDEVWGVIGTLTKYAWLSGTVKNWDGSSALSGITVEVNTLKSYGWHREITATTDALGYWRVRLPVNDYYVAYSDPTDKHYDSFHKNADTADEARAAVLVVEGTDLEARMDTDGTIEGVVTNIAGTPLDRVLVEAYRLVADEYMLASEVLTGDSGRFALSLRTDSYVLRFSDEAGRYLGEYYNDVVAPELSTAIVATLGGNEVAVALDSASHLLGSARDARTGSPLSGASVTLMAVGNDAKLIETDMRTSVASDGTFSFEAVHSGNYTIRVDVAGAPGAAWFLGDTRQATAASAFEVSTDTTISDLDVLGAYDADAPLTTSNAINRVLVAPTTLALTASDATAVETTYYRIDNGAWTSGTSPELETIGSHVLEFYSVDTLGTAEEIRTETLRVFDSAVTYLSLAGSSRYETALEISRNAFPEGADAVIIVTGANWPDGLGASALAGVMDAPVLLVPTDYIPGSVITELGRIAPQRTIIVGGTKAVSTEVEGYLNEMLGAANVDRIGGTSRYDTAALVARRMMQVLSDQGIAWDGSYFLSSGANFPDALAASPLAASQRWPILLTGTDALSAETSAFLTDHDIAQGFVLGGLNAVSDAVVSQAHAVSGSPLERISGSTRYQTALALAEFSMDRGLLDYSRIAVATGQSFPDAMTSGVRQAKNGSVLVLTPGTSLDPGVVDLIAQEGMTEVREVTFIGGASAISQEVRETLAMRLAAMEN